MDTICILYNRAGVVKNNFRIFGKDHDRKDPRDLEANFNFTLSEVRDESYVPQLIMTE